MNQEKLQQLFEYKNGKLLNNSTRSPKAVKGSEAGGINPSNGYKRIVINGKTYQYSRLVWAYHNGDMVFQLTSDTSLEIKVKGSDGTVRSVALTLA